MGVAERAVEGTPTSAVTPSPSKVSANKKTGIRIKGRPHQGATQIHMYVEKRGGEEGRKETKKDTYL